MGNVSVTSKESLMSTKPGKQIMKQGLFKSKGFKLFNKYKLHNRSLYLLIISD